MRLTIFAASGGIGRLLLHQATDAGHDVTAVVRDPGRLPATPARVLTADLADPDPATLRAAVEGADAVLSALGPVSKAEAGVAWRGTDAIVTAMRETGARRLVAVSAAPVGTVPSPGRPHPPRHDPGDGLVLRTLAYPLLKAVLRAHYADLARMEDVLRDSGLDWTAVRPVYLSDKPVTGTYRTAHDQNLRHGTSISRADVAHCMLAVLTRPATVGRTVSVAY
ncbi:NAD(P)H-binding protein [Kitasatospora sp. NPDC048540]|uniref:NAD(P)-dependent oxidoreductase n=1 Tax=unclassified Kitasatospora TaxID=2633591 RepID=UPI000539DF53|nr:NAD(P)H-binding protein [Kitasatospora sp. MBT63]